MFVSKGTLCSILWWFVEWGLVLAYGVGACSPQHSRMTDSDVRVGVLCGLCCCAVANVTVTECMPYVLCVPMAQSPFKCVGLHPMLWWWSVCEWAAGVIYCAHGFIRLRTRPSCHCGFVGFLTGPAVAILVRLLPVTVCFRILGRMTLLPAAIGLCQCTLQPIM